MWGGRGHSGACAIAGSKEWEKRLLETARREGCIERVTSQGGARELINHLTSFPFSCLPPIRAPHWSNPTVHHRSGQLFMWSRQGSLQGRQQKRKSWRADRRGNVRYPESQGLHWAWGHNINKSAWRALQTNLFFYVSSNNERRGKGFIIKRKSIQNLKKSLYIKYLGLCLHIY